jgi:two-component system, chemotaxis family, chemotaxis protein CheY
MEGKTILLIEDDPIILDWFGLILSEHGYTVTLARNGKAGVEFLEKHGSPRLIILNMMMPVMDGWQFLKERDRQWHSVPVLIVTGVDIASDEWAASLGAQSWLRKPVQGDRLLEKVQKCLQP